MQGLQQLWASRAAPQLEKEDLLNRVRDLETQIRLNMREVRPASKKATVPLFQTF